MKTQPSQELIDARYRAKLAARADGSKPVMPPEAPSQVDLSLGVEDRYRAKLAARLQPASAPAPVAEEPPAADEVKAETKSGKRR